MALLVRLSEEQRVEYFDRAMAEALERIADEANSAGVDPRQLADQVEGEGDRIWSSCSEEESDVAQVLERVAESQSSVASQVLKGSQAAEPIKVGYLMDFTLPPGFPEELMASFTRCFDLVFEEAVEQGLMDRPVQMIYREVEGLPKGSVKSVIDAFGELDEG